MYVYEKYSLLIWLKILFLILLPEYQRYCILVPCISESGKIFLFEMDSENLTFTRIRFENVDLQLGKSALFLKAL